jgi:cell division topological specificity factor
MRELLRWLFNISGKELDQATEALSKDTAKQRLKLVLIQDRLELAPEKLEEMKKEIWEVVSKYMVVDDDFMEFEVRRLDDLTVLVSNIEVKDLSELTPEPAT